MQEIPQLAVQKFLATHSLEDLTTEYSIKVKHYEHVVCLNYNQIKSPKTAAITIECRALKLYKDAHWTVASRAFDRFFNVGEAESVCEAFCFDTAVVAEKVDGSLIPVWYDKTTNRWEISTRGSCFAEKGGPRGGKSFNELVRSVFPQLDAVMQAQDSDWTFLWELIGPSNLVVTPYDQDELVLLGIRHNLTGAYKSIAEMEAFVTDCNKPPCPPEQRVRMCKYYQFSSLVDAAHFASTFTRLEEGFVCWDTRSGIRIKIKSRQYVAMHSFRGQKNQDLASPESILSVVLAGETDEFVAYYPHLQAKFVEAKEKVDRFKARLALEYQEIQHLSQKEYAAAVFSSNWLKLNSRLFFSARKTGKIEDAFDELPTDAKLRLLQEE